MTCCVCDRDEVKALDNPLAPEFRWLTKLSCDPCGEVHSVCRACYMRWRMGSRVEAFEWATVGAKRAGARLEVCPASDEFKVALSLGEG